VAETKSSLGKLSTFNSVRLLCVPGHNNVPGNEIPDELAKQAATSEFIGPEPVFGTSSNTAQNTISSWDLFYLDMYTGPHSMETTCGDS